MKSQTIAIMLAVSSAVVAQTKVDLQTQTKNPDFTNFTEMKLSKTGATLPATCTTGATYLKVDGPAGQNIYVCTAPNAWALQASPAGPDCGASVNGAVLKVVSGAALLSPCRFRINDSSYVFNAEAVLTITAGSGSGLARAYLSLGGNLVLEVSTSAGLTINALNAVVLTSTAPSFPPGTLPLASITINSGSWGTVTDERAKAGGREWFSAGTGIATISNGVIAVDSTVAMLGANNGWTGRNDFSASTSQTLVRGTGDPASGCSAASDVGKVYVRGDGPPSNNLWICENNGGTRRWVKMAPVSVQTAGQGYFTPSAALVNGGFQTLTAATTYFYQVTLPFPMTVRRVTLQTNGGGTSGQALAIGIFDSSCNLLRGATGRVVGLASAGGIQITLSSPQNLSPGVYHFGVSTESGVAGFNVSSTGSASLLLNAGSDTRLFVGASAPTGSGNTFTLPASCGTKTQNANAALNFVWLP